MSDLQLTVTRVYQGVWEGVVNGPKGAQPTIAVTHDEKAISGVELTADPENAGQWQLRFAIPGQALSEGVQTFLIRDTQADADLGSFSIAMGDALNADIRAEVDLLRAELDMLKRAFRRHCLETA